MLDPWARWDEGLADFQSCSHIGVCLFGAFPILLFFSLRLMKVFKGTQEEGTPEEGTLKSAHVILARMSYFLSTGRQAPDDKSSTQ